MLSLYDIFLVSDSLLAFQQAERLAQENLSESEMAAALDEQKNHAYIQKGKYM